MAKKIKMWRVRPEFVGRVRIESQISQVLLDDTLSQKELAELAKSDAVIGFLEKIAVKQTEHAN